jgi:hypothetical protein
LNFKQGPYLYSIERQGDQSIYSVTDGKETIALPILYAFGQGKIAQTYVFQYMGKFYESRVSFYNRINGLDLTIGAAPSIPTSIDSALGRVLSSSLINDSIGQNDSRNHLRRVSRPGRKTCHDDEVAQ